MRHHPADNGHQHHKGRDADDPARGLARHGVQLEVKAIEKAAAPGFAYLQRLTTGRIQRQTLSPAPTDSLTRSEPLYLQLRIALIRQINLPQLRIDGALLQLLQRQLGALRPRRRGVQLRLHPVTDFVLKKAQGAGQKHRVQQPPQQQPHPGVQPGIALAKAHTVHSSSRQIRCNAAGRQLSTAISQARAALRAQNAQITSTQ